MKPMEVIVRKLQNLELKINRLDQEVDGLTAKIVSLNELISNIHDHVEQGRENPPPSEEKEISSGWWFG